MPSRALATLVFVACISKSQFTSAQHIASETARNPVSLCNPAAIDSTFAFHDQPAGEQTVSLYFVNKGDTACRLKDPPNPSFSVDGHSMDVPSCPFCGPDDRSMPMWNRRPENEAVLQPGASTAIDINWVSAGGSCQWADWAAIFFNWSDSDDYHKFTNFLFIPSDWPMRICSPVRSSGYRSASDSPFAGERTDPALDVSVLQKTIYSDERATLHVVLARPSQANERSIGCDSLYTVRSIAPSPIRLDPLRTLGSVKVDSYTPEQIKEDKERRWPEWKADFQRECGIAAGTMSADAEIAASDLATVTRIEWRTAPVPGKDDVFFTALTHFTVLDIDTLPPNWGQTVKGIRAGLSVDRVKFAVGERVPLHIRWENRSAAVALGQGECHEPRPALEIQNSKHQVLKTLATEPQCSGHGWGPFVVEKGIAQHEFFQLTTAAPPLSLSTVFIPPNSLASGVYYLVSVWSPRVLDTSDTARSKSLSGAGRLGDIYASARSLPVRIEVGRISSNR